MPMPYTQNPYLPKLRAEAVKMVRSGNGVRATARNFGVSPGTISKWCQRMPSGGCHLIPTRSSRPKYHPRQLSENIVRRIVELRLETNGRCAEVIHQMLLNENLEVSLSSVKRTLERQSLTKKRSPWKRYHQSPERPEVAQPGDLVQVDTIHVMPDKQNRYYVYTLIDLFSRWAYARAVDKINAVQSVTFVGTAKRLFPFQIRCLQTYNGPEFSQHFSERTKTTHRHSRVRKPNDNAHLERFNRTIQNELLDRIPKDVSCINRLLPKYLKYYNEQRLHLGLNLKTPNQIIQKCFQAID